MSIVVLANLIAVAVAVWAVWELGLISLASRYDSSKSATLILFALGAALDSPLRVLGEASQSLTGRYYVLTVIGHICYLFAAASGVKYIYLRLLPEPDINLFVKVRAATPTLLAAAMMVVFFMSTPLPIAGGADHLYLVRPDGWLAAYWTTFYGTLTGLLVTAMYGVNRLRADPRSVMLNLLLCSLGLGVLSIVGSAVGLLTGRNEEVRHYAWPLTYAAIAVGSLAVVFAWRHRIRMMLGSKAE